MQKSPDEIKKGLACAGLHTCPDEKCPYYASCAPCELQVQDDALVLIQQLQDDNAEQAERIQRLEAQNAELLENIMWMEAERDDFKRAIQQLEAERDAAVNALRLVQEKHEKADEVIDDEVFPLVDYDVYRRLRDTVDDMMNWEVESDSRGVQKEE